MVLQYTNQHGDRKSGKVTALLLYIPINKTDCVNIIWTFGRISNVKSAIFDKITNNSFPKTILHNNVFDSTNEYRIQKQVHR